MSGATPTVSPLPGEQDEAGQVAQGVRQGQDFVVNPPFDLPDAIGPLR